MSLQTNDRQYRLGFIGGGKLAGSVMRGLVRAKFCPPEQILVSEPNATARTALGEELGGIGLTAENAEVAERAEVIFIGVKPGVVLNVIAGMSRGIEGKLVVSLAAGIRVASMEEKGEARFMRAMTNTPAAVCQAATAIARGSRTTDEDMAMLHRIFSSIGTVIEVKEAQVDAVTALAGSGPAFVYTVIEALAVGGEKCGLPAEVSLGLATQTVRGAAQLALESGRSPEELRNMVITPGGTTAAGLARMEEIGSAAGLTAAVEAASARAEELASDH
ncbi:MAG: pyrroline-5-carboxylate reductase [Chthoniobacterales bacterium]